MKTTFGSPSNEGWYKRLNYMKTMKVEQMETVKGGLLAVEICQIAFFMAWNGPASQQVAWTNAFEAGGCQALLGM